MGRRPKYSSSSERYMAIRLQKAAYARSDKGKATRNARNRAARSNEHTHSEFSPSITRLAPLPNSLVEMALRPLPESAPLFVEALSSPDALDEGGLEQWDDDPPYLSPPPPETPSEDNYTARLVEVMHGRRLRIERARVAARLAEFSRDEDGLRTTLASELEEMLVKWEALELFTAGDSSCSRHRRMAEHLLQWRARLVYSAHQELELLGKKCTVDKNVGS
ncbi:hypothetical protein PLICRDRAFT_28849 [Plicaturopsis crispa FD-325 SS-3]|nr:hypothetical protein PLICRDRAFT_28849 [Plicaturopsis crispa FD-325 SS-3]